MPSRPSFGRVVRLRAGVTDRIDDYDYVPFFPATPALLNTNLKSLSFIEATFLDAAFRHVHHEVIASDAASDWPSYAERTALRADSILAQHTDVEFQCGVAALREFAVSGPPGPVVDPVDFFVFRRT